MEKKNTMLLTVIAVATLLVAVVGATFAFFSLQVSGNSTTDATVTAAKVGTATISTVTDNAELKLDLTSANMAKFQQDQVYYASVDGIAPGSADPIEIANIAYDGGEEDTTYNCPVQVNVSVSGKMIDDGTLKEKWTELILAGDAVNQTSAQEQISVPGTTKGENDELKVDLQKALAAGPQQGSKKVTFKGNVTVSGPTTAAKNILKASLSLTNLAGTDQSAIADSNLVVTIAVEPDGACALQTD